MFRIALALSAALAVAAPVSADPVTYTYTGPTVGIPDSNAAGVNLDITVTDTFALTQFQRVSVTMGNTHTWVGDLRITLTHVPTNTTIDLIRRPGARSGNNFGDSSDFGGTYTFSNLDTLTSASTPRVIDSADINGPSMLVFPGVYRPTTNSLVGNGSPTFSGETITSLNTTFDGLSSVAGVWRLNISDNSGGDTGSIAGFSFTIDAAADVPEPGTLAVFGLLGVGGLAARRRKRAA